MAIVPASDSVALEEFISQMRAGSIRVNRTYQRSGGIWPARAKSFLVETVLLQMPIPRVLLHVVNSTESDIIDGQQRCTILRQFREGRFALTGVVDHAVFQGKRFSELTVKQRERFNNYPVPVDRYSGITPRQIREVFRRLNYYTAPLNAAEQRHAQFIGELSRFVEGQSRNWNSTFRRISTFTTKQMRRKADEQLMAEVVAAMLDGISTPNARSLRKVYEDHNIAFSSAIDFGRRLDHARGTIDTWRNLRKNTLMRKHYHVFSLLVALLHAQGNLASVRRDLGTARALLPEDRIVRRLERLEDAVNRKMSKGRYAGFWLASEAKTNVRENRLARSRYFYSALTGRSPKTK
jgi:hypothetical protein